MYKLRNDVLRIFRNTFFDSIHILNFNTEDLKRLIVCFQYEKKILFVQKSNRLFIYFIFAELIWTQNMIVLLISCYRKMTNDGQKEGVVKKTVFIEAAKRLNSVGMYPQVNWTQCQSKYNKLISKYKEHKDSQAQSGSGKKFFEHYDIINEYMHNNPQIAPVSLTSNLKGFRERQDETNTSSSEEERLTKKVKKDRKIKKSKKSKKATEISELCEVMRERNEVQKQIAANLSRYVNTVEKNFSKD